jgi:hypothetical protein
MTRPVIPSVQTESGRRENVVRFLVSGELLVTNATFRLACLILLLAPVLSPPSVARVIWEDRESFVRLDDAGRDAMPNEHPADFSVDEVTAMLGALQVVPRKAKQSVPLFTVEELQILGPHIVTALAQASPSQDVRFRSRGAHSESVFLGRKLLVSEGVLFVSDGRLNVIFNRLQEEARKRNVYGQRDEDFYSADEPSRQREAKLSRATLLSSPGVEQKLDGGAVRQDWVLIDPDASGYAASEPAPSAAPATAATGAPATGDAAPAAAAAAGAAAAGVAASGATDPGAATSAPASGGDYVPLEERLRRLKALRDEGLITEDAYLEKMRELLLEL